MNSVTYTHELFCASVKKSHYPESIKAQMYQLASQMGKAWARGWHKKAWRLSDEIARLVKANRRAPNGQRPATEVRSVC